MLLQDKYAHSYGGEAMCLFSLSNF